MFECFPDVQVEVQVEVQVLRFLVDSIVRVGFADWSRFIAACLLDFSEPVSCAARIGQIANRAPAMVAIFFDGVIFPVDYGDTCRCDDEMATFLDFLSGDRSQVVGVRGILKWDLQVCNAMIPI